MADKNLNRSKEILEYGKCMSFIIKVDIKNIFRHIYRNDKTDFYISASVIFIYCSWRKSGYFLLFMVFHPYLWIFDSSQLKVLTLYVLPKKKPSLTATFTEQLFIHVIITVWQKGSFCISKDIGLSKNKAFLSLLFWLSFVIIHIIYIHNSASY